MSTLRAALRIARGDTTAAPAAPVEQRSTSLLGTMGLPGTQLGGGLAQSERSFDAVAVAYRCVALNAQNLATVPMVVVTGDDDATPDHEVARLWNVGGPDQPTSARVVRETLWSRAELTGEAFAFIDRGDTGTGPARGLHVLYGRVRVVVEPGDRGIGTRVKGFTVTDESGRQIGLLPSEVLWLRYPHPFEPWGCLAPWKAALHPVESDAYARAWQRAEFKNGARPSSVIDLGEVSDDVYQAAVASIRTRHSGPDNAGKSIVISQSPLRQTNSKMDVKHLSLTPAEMSYLESRVANADEVCMAFGINPDAIRGGSTYENVAAAKTSHWSDTLLPKLDVAASEFDRQLLPAENESIGWDLSGVDALRDSQDAVITRASNAVYPDIMTIDEARAVMGLEPLPSGKGAYTLTEYRARVTNEANVDTLPGFGDPAARAQRPAVVRVDARTIEVHAREVGPDGVVDVTQHVQLPGSTRVAGRTLDVRRELITSPAPRRRSTASREREVLDVYDRHERIGQKAVRKLAERQAKAVKRELDKQRRALDAGAITRSQVRAMLSGRIFDATYWERESREALEPFVDGVWAEGGQRAATQLDQVWSQLSPRVVEQMNARLGILSSQITDTTRQAIESELLAEGVDEGEGIDKLANRIMDVFEDLGRHRAETIARTETVGGFNAATHVVVAETGIAVVREWLATLDERTRESHAALNGRRIRGLEEAWPNDCKFPGDPEGPPEETINCRCVELFDEEDED